MLFGMAKKKKPRSEPGKEKPGKARKRPESGFDSDSVDFGFFPDPRTMEGLLQTFLEGRVPRGGSGKKKSKKAATPLEKADELIELALGEENAQKRVKMALEALALSADCVDAHVLLAEEEALALIARHDRNRRLLR